MVLEEPAGCTCAMEEATYRIDKGIISGKLSRSREGPWKLLAALIASTISDNRSLSK